MLQSSADVDFAEETLATHGRAPVGSEHLDGHPGIVAQVAGEIHRGHAAAADLVQQLIAIAEGGRERLLQWRAPPFSLAHPRRQRAHQPDAPRTPPDRSGC